MTTFAVIGAGHRAAFYLRAARLYPGDMKATGAVIRKAEKREAFTEYWGIPAYETIEELLAASRPDFAILCVPPAAALPYMETLAAEGVAMLCETPPAIELENLHKVWALVQKGAKIQVAEQYNFVPRHAARLNIASSGKLGEVSYARISVAHDYHGLSMLRHFLGLGFENARVTALQVGGKLLDGPVRSDTRVPDRTKVVDTQQTLAIFEWEGKTGLFDFMGEQYASWVRRQHVLVYGEKGEIVENEVHLLLDEKTPVNLTLNRMDTAEYDYMYLHGYTLGSEWVYKNPYLPKLAGSTPSTYYGREWDFASPAMRITDDEIAVLDLLFGMCRYVQGGPEVYSFAEGAQDQYMQLVLQKAVETGKPVEMESQPWAKP